MLYLGMENKKAQNSVTKLDELLKEIKLLDEEISKFSNNSQKPVVTKTNCCALSNPKKLARSVWAS